MSTNEMHWLGYAITGKELVAMEDLDRFGIKYWKGLRIEFERRGKVRTAEPFEYAALPNYIWIQPEAHQVARLSEVRFLGHTFRQMHSHMVREFAIFRDKIEAKEAEARALIEERKKLAEAAKRKEADAAKRMALYRTAIAAYQEVALIEIREGPLAGELAKFKRLVQGASEPFPRIEAEMQMMGQLISVKLDPLSVCKAV